MIETDAAIDALLCGPPFAVAPATDVGDFALALTPSEEGHLADWLSETATDVMSVLDQVGAILFRGFPDGGDIEFDRCIEALGLQPSHCLTRYVKIAPLGYLQPMRPPQSWKYFYTMKWRRHLYIPAISSFIVNKLLHRGALHPYVGQII